MSDITTIPPPELTITGLHSPDDHIQSRRQVKIVPREQNQFGQQTVDSFGASLSDRTTLYISDSRGFLDSPNSYLTGEFEAHVRTAAGTDGVDLDAFLDEGGVHSCIRSLTLKSGSAVIERIEDYAKLYNIVKFSTVGDSHIDSVEMMSLDGASDFKELVPAGNYAVGQNESLTNIPFDTTFALDADGECTVVDGGGTFLALTNLKIGDEVSFECVVAGDHFTHRAFVTRVQTNLLFNVSPVPPVAVAAGAGLIHRIDRLGKYEQRAMRSLAVNGFRRNDAANKLRFTIKPMLKFFQQHKYIPLFLLNSPLELQIEWMPARLCLVNRSTSVPATDVFAYRIQRLRYVASIVEVDDSTYNTYMDVMENGVLQYPYQSWRRHNDQIAKSVVTSQLTFQANLISARMVCSVLCPATTTETDVGDAGVVKSQSRFEKSGITDYRFSSGSLKYPDYGVVECDDVLSAEAFAQMQLAFNHHSNTLHDTRGGYQNWLEGSYNNPNATTVVNPTDYSSDKFIMCANLSAHSGFMTGADIHQNPLQLDINKAVEDVAFNLKTFIYFDSVLEISRANGVLVKN